MSKLKMDTDVISGSVINSIDDAKEKVNSSKNKLSGLKVPGEFSGASLINDVISDLNEAEGNLTKIENWLRKCVNKINQTDSNERGNTNAIIINHIKKRDKIVKKTNVTIKRK